MRAGAYRVGRTRRPRSLLNHGGSYTLFEWEIFLPMKFFGILNCYNAIAPFTIAGVAL